ncbi:MAG: aminopeptidase, partial [Verrucomicrobiaceae bacterium]|nr:aminopeptidase [Verrucomicrobiaceae bacterium]
LKRPYVVWVVYAAEAFQVEPKQWWYPFVGKLAYRGFFEKEDAKAEALKLKNAGFDVFAAGVEAYSTLGYFKDPVLNTCMHRSDAELAELVFHELTHCRLFIPGDTNFNEAFATANGQAGVRRWLRSKGRMAELREYEAHLKDEQEVVRLALEARERLRGLYATETTPVKQKDAILTALQRKLERLGLKEQATDVKSGKDMKLVWNNARLNTMATYFKLVPGFERLLRQGGGDVETFYREVEALGKKSAEERNRVLTSAR